MEDVDYETVPNSPLAINLMAGALAGITEHSIMYPMDSIKTRMQVLHPSPSAVYSGISQAISRISTTEGVYALWRGVNSVIVGAGPAHALYFATYEKCKDAFGAGGDGKRQIMASGVYFFFKRAIFCLFFFGKGVLTWVCSTLMQCDHLFFFLWVCLSFWMSLFYRC